MTVAIAGVGWITPLGSDLREVAQAVETGAQPELKNVTNPETGRIHACKAVPPAAVAHLSRNPRLRRSSVISYFAVAAAQAAIADARLTITSEDAARVAVVLAVSNGGVVYTRRFYEQIAREGAHAASPLLFPETVYNAPASHLAAALGIDGASYTLVGDQSSGLEALHFGGQLLALEQADHCIIVGCEELDWILCEAYRDWRCARTPLAEGAGAVVLQRSGTCAITTHPGAPFFRQRDAGDALEKTVGDLKLKQPPALFVGSSNGTFVDAHEAACARQFPDAKVLRPAISLGQAPGASALWQTILGALAVRDGTADDALISVIGLNQQASAALIRRQAP